jgi:hypothetical protein
MTLSGHQARATAACRAACNAHKIFWFFDPFIWGWRIALFRLAYFGQRHRDLALVNKQTAPHSTNCSKKWQYPN